MIRLFMAISHVVREILIAIICTALILLTILCEWLMSEKDRKALQARKEKLND